MGSDLNDSKALALKMVEASEALIWKQGLVTVEAAAFLQSSGKQLLFQVILRVSTIGDHPRVIVENSGAQGVSFQLSSGAAVPELREESP